METPTSAGLETIAAEKSEIAARDAQDQTPGISALAANGSKQAPHGTKRAAEDDLDAEEEDNNGDEVVITTDGVTDGEKPLSKNQQRKLKRRKLWEERKGDRKEKRKEKRHNKQERKRLEQEAEKELAAKEGREPKLLYRKERNRDLQAKSSVPVTIILDCQYEEYMEEKELISLSSQITRSYSDSRTANYRAHLYVSSFGGSLEHRFQTALAGQYKSWKGITFTQEDFVQAAKSARDVMTGPEGGAVIEVLQSKDSNSSVYFAGPNAKKKNAAPEAEPEAEDVDKSIVYLTADSPYVLDRLEPNTSYIVGGIIDRNRHKGLCYQVARQRNVRTAKLPIGEYMILQDRHVLATNHVVEIILRWLELGDWGAAFMKVIPPRKGGKLKDGPEGSEAAGDVADSLAEAVEGTVEGGSS